MSLESTLAEFVREHSLTRSSVRALREEVDPDGERLGDLAERISRTEVVDVHEGVRAALAALRTDKRFLNVVADLGVDGDEGGDPVDDALQSAIREGDGDVVLWVPEGRYRLDGLGPLTAPGVELRGRNAALVPTPRDGLDVWLDVRGDGAVVDGFEFDFRAADPAPVTQFWAPNWTLRNVVFRGEMGVRDHGDLMGEERHGVSALNVAATDPDGVGRLDTVYMADGAAPPGTRDNRRAVFVNADAEADHAGRLDVHRLWAERWCENTLYGDYGRGSVHLSECYVRNSPVGLRVPGGSTVEDCTVVKDGPVPFQRASLVGEGTNRMRGVWVRAGNNPYSREEPVEIRGCDFVFTDDTAGTMGQPLNLSPPSTLTRVEDTRVYLDSDRWAAVHLDPLDDPGTDADAPENPRIDLVDLQVISTNESEPAVRFDRAADPGEVSGVVSCPGGVATDPAVASALAEGEPERADPSAPMPPPPPEGTTPGR